MIANLQALRFFAALMVLLHHGRRLYGALGGENALLETISHVGYSGVDVFFVISGYVMWHTTAQRSGPAAARDFLAGRLIRIYPIYWILLAAGIGVYWLTDWGPLAEKSLFHSVFLSTTRQTAHFLQVAWTLSFELYFYALFGGLVLLPKAAARPLLIAGLVFTLAINVLPSAPLQNSTAFLLSPFLLEFLVGALLPGLVRFGRSRLLLVLLFAAAVAAFLLGVEIDERRGMGRVASFGTFGVLLVYVAVAAEAHQIFRCGRWLLLLGGASYTLYLTILSAIRLLEWSGVCPALAPLGGLTPELGYLVILAAIIGTSVAIHGSVEQPLLAGLKQQYRRWMR